MTAEYRDVGFHDAGGREGCEHEPVFSGERQPTGNPFWFWICAKCGRIDRRQFESEAVRPPLDMPRFAQLLNDLRGEPFFLRWLEHRAQNQNAAPAREG
jgi:hypothetical protein